MVQWCANAYIRKMKLSGWCWGLCLFIFFRRNQFTDSFIHSTSRAYPKYALHWNIWRGIWWERVELKRICSAWAASALCLHFIVLLLSCWRLSSTDYILTVELLLFTSLFLEFPQRFASLFSIVQFQSSNSTKRTGYKTSLSATISSLSLFFEYDLFDRISWAFFISRCQHTNRIK